MSSYMYVLTFCFSYGSQKGVPGLVSFCLVSLPRPSSGCLLSIVNFRTWDYIKVKVQYKLLVSLVMVYFFF